MSDVNDPCLYCGHIGCREDYRHAEWVCQECFDNRNQFLELKRSNDLREESNILMLRLLNEGHDSAPFYTSQQKPVPTERTSPNVQAPGVPRVQRRGL